MSINHLAASASAEDINAALGEDGACVVDHVAAPEIMDAVAEELRPFTDATPFGPDNFSGRRTRRTGGLIARSKTCRDLVMHPTVLGGVGKLLSHATSFQLHLTQIISIGAGEPAQTIHRDQWAFDFFSFPRGYEVQCNTIWAITDFTAENGATRVIPGSNRYDDKLRFAESDTEPAEMTKGSVLFLYGKHLPRRRRESLERYAHRDQHYLQRLVAAPGGEPISIGAARNCAHAAGRVAPPYGLPPGCVCSRLRG